MIVVTTAGYKRRGVRSTIDDNLISFINVIFLILIFFMIAGRLEKSSVFDIDPPVSASQTERQESNLQIELAADGQMAVNGDELNRVELVELIRNLQQEAIQPQLEVRADANVKMQHLNNLLNRIKASGVQKVTILSVPRP